MNFNPLDNAICLEFPLWLEETAWAGHIPFAMFLISAMRPRTFVELGVDRGVSYCAFCQTVESCKTNTKCYAVDTWQGDEHAGKRDKDVLIKLKGHHDPLYSEFSRLIQSTFADGLRHFDNGSIDLLHIDGFHTYEAVKQDFHSWLPKLSERAIVLFHDTTVRERDFGVWKFWSEAARDYPHFEFLHSHGLGVLAVGREIPESLKNLFQASESESETIRHFFQALGERIEAVLQHRMQIDYIRELETYAEIVNNSRVMAAYRTLKYEGLRSLLKKNY